MVEPRWVRARRREAARAAARRDAVVDRILRQVAADPRARRRSADELMQEQGIRPFDAARFRRVAGLTGRDVDELRAAIEAVRER